jgi:HK97 family phage major capsid protein
MTRSQKLAAEIVEKGKAFSELMAKETLTETEATQVKELNTEIKGLRASHDEAVTLEKDADENARYVDALTGDPVNLRHDAGTTGEVKNQGFNPAGETVIDKKTMATIYEEGELGLSRKQLESISSIDYKRAFKNYMRKGVNGLSGGEVKTLQEGVDASGGFLVPEDVLSTIIDKKPTPTRVAGLVETLQTSRDNLSISKVNYTTDNKYTTGMRVTWTGENPTSNTQHRVTDPAFGQVRIPIHTAMMSLPLTLDMIEDSAFPMVSWASGKFQETVGLLKDDMIINGSGIGQPSGILLSPGSANQPDIVVSGSGTALLGDGLWDLVYTLPEQYDENARMLLNKTSTGRAIAKLKDSQNRYLFGYGDQDNGLAGARPKELCGYPYIYSAMMPDVAANAYPIIFGDFRGYYLVNRIGFSIQVLKERYAEENQVVLLGRVRFGGQVVEDWRLKIQKVST